MKPYQRGDVVIIDVPMLANSHIQAGKRPWVVVQNNVGNQFSSTSIGTGVTYPDDHPEAEELGMKRGEYGQGHGKQHSWGYYGDPGTNGVLKEKKNGGFVVITHGNPANMPMYETVKELQDRLTEIAKEVFS